MARSRAITRYRTRFVRSRGRRRSKAFTVPIAALAGLAPTVIYAADVYSKRGIVPAMSEVVRDWTGYDPETGTWAVWRLKYGLMPAVAGILVHKLAGKVGINRALGRAGVPFLRI